MMEVQIGWVLARVRLEIQVLEGNIVLAPDGRRVDAEGWFHVDELVCAGADAPSAVGMCLGKVRRASRPSHDCTQPSQESTAVEIDPQMVDSFAQ